MIGGGVGLGAGGAPAGADAPGDGDVPAGALGTILGNVPADDDGAGSAAGARVVCADGMGVGIPGPDTPFEGLSVSELGALARVDVLAGAGAEPA